MRAITVRQRLEGCDAVDRSRNLEASRRNTRTRPQRTKLVCRGCPVRLECLHHAISTGERFGIHGGLNTDERRALERKAIA